MNMNVSRTMTQNREDFVPARRSPWVWGIGAIILATLCANFTMIYVGLNTHPGLVVEDFYARGKNYFNAEVKRVEDENRLGWKLDVIPPGVMKMNVTQKYRLVVLDREGYPVSGGTAELAAFRPSKASGDFSLPMMETGGGEYQAEVNFTKPGKWDLIVTVQRGDDRMDVAQRIFVEK